MERYFIKKTVSLCLEEDLRGSADITSESIFTNEEVLFSLVSREELIFCGGDFIREIFLRFRISDYEIYKCEGDRIGSGVIMVQGKAPAKLLFTLERTLVNLVQRASGVASMTGKFVEAVSGTNAKIRGTRKTMPGLRELDIYAIKIGGGENYRRGLYDKIMIKDNHICGCGGIKNAISRVRKSYGESVPIAIECDEVAQVRIAVDENVDLILLDNMSIEDLKKSVSITSASVLSEASGGVNIRNVSEIAASGVDYISVGAITHSVISVDIGLDVFVSG